MVDQTVDIELVEIEDVDIVSSEIVYLARLLFSRYLSILRFNSTQSSIQASGLGFPVFTSNQELGYVPYSQNELPFYTADGTLTFVLLTESAP